MNRRPESTGKPQGATLDSKNRFHHKEHLMYRNLRNALYFLAGTALAALMMV